MRSGDEPGQGRVPSRSAATGAGVRSGSVRPGMAAAFALLGVVLLMLAACGGGYSGYSGSTSTLGGSSGGSSSTSTSTPSSTPGSSSGGISGGASHLQVFIEPDAGEKPILQAIQGANSSIDLEIYLLSDSYVIHALEDAASRGVQVRVLLETSPYGGSTPSPQQVLDELNAAGVNAKGADPSYHFTHEKAMVIDGATVYIMTSNFTRSGLGTSNYTNNREYGIIDANSQDVREVEDIFSADWNRQQTPSLNDANLVVSPVNARSRLEAFIGAARKTLDIEDEEMYDQQTISDLVAAAHRGVNVEVVLPAPSGSSNSDQDAAVATLTSGGVHVRYIQNPYMHAKLMIEDNTEAFVGSENFSATSLDQNREVGIFIADASVLTSLEQTFGQDWSASQNA